VRETAFGNDKIQAGIIFFWRNKITGSYKKGEKERKTGKNGKSFILFCLTYKPSQKN